MEVEALKKLKQMTEKNIVELTKKNEISAAETSALKNGADLLDWLNYQIEKCEMKESEHPQYSGHDGIRATPRRYNITSYGYPPYMDYDGGVYYAEDGRSYTMVPTPMMAQASQMSRNSMRSNNQGYSRHSINDRAVSCLEKMMDSTDSDYERQQVGKFIEMIRSAE